LLSASEKSGLSELRQRPLATKANFAEALNKSRHRSSRESFATALECDEGAPAREPLLSAAHHNRDLVLGEAADLIMWRTVTGQCDYPSPRARIVAALVDSALASCGRAF
jgi:hypothetical protein